ncbi:hypothetical protein GCM10009539_58840 [Cryptosporangium japonicum]|uniref:Uncharacterized protein n=1 Tax=Cryptosporangium japonicum TaxID=80872 RepID=A0ABN0UXU4_9ACTN
MLDDECDDVSRSRGEEWVCQFRIRVRNMDTAAVHHWFSKLLRLSEGVGGRSGTSAAGMGWSRSDVSLGDAVTASGAAGGSGAVAQRVGLTGAADRGQ